MAAMPDAVRVDETPGFGGQGVIEVQRAATRLMQMDEVLPGEREVENVLISISARVGKAKVQSRQPLRVVIVKESQFSEPWYVAYLVEHPRFCGDGQTRNTAIDTLVNNMVDDLLVYRDARKLSLDAQEARTALSSVLQVK